MPSVYDLTDADCNEIETFSFDGKRLVCKIIKVCDGDTIKCVFEYNSRLYKMNFRLYGIDTCELRDKDIQKRELAYKAKERVEELIESVDKKIVDVECKKYDKYGRVLAVIHVPGRDDTLNDILLNEGLAVPYYGGKKQV